MLNPATTLAIILGVRECPRAPKLEPLPQCANSAIEFERYLRSTLSLAPSQVINLFNSEISASDQLEQIEDWLIKLTASDAGARPTDLIVFYTGHGGFARSDQSYFLAVHRTREGSEGATSIRYSDLASIIKRNTESVRKYLILDCCFAAAAVLRLQTDLHDAVIQKVQDELPPSGTAVLCSSAAKLVSIAPPGEPYTMFSGALLQCLREGIADGPPALTLEDVGKAARRIIQDKYPSDAVRPELHVPEQTRGNPAQVPLFPNPLWKLNSAEGQRAKPALPVAAIAETSFTTAVRSPLVRMALGVSSGLLSALTCAFMVVPFGLVSEPIGAPPSTPPLGPAFCLTATVLLVLSATSRMGWRSVVLTPVAAYVSWSAAWTFLYHVTLELKGWLLLLYPINSGSAGYIGSLLFTLALTVILHGRGSLTRIALLEAARASVSPALWAAIAGIPVIAALLTGLWKPVTPDLSFTSFSTLLGLFLPWQAVYLARVTKTSGGQGHNPVERRHYVLWFVASAAFLGALATPFVRVPLDYFPLSPGIRLTIGSATSEVLAAQQSKIVVNYAIEKIKISGRLDCTLEVRVGQVIFTTPVPEEHGRGEIVVPKKVASSESGGNVYARATCAIPLGAPYVSNWADSGLITVDEPG